MQKATGSMLASLLALVIMVVMVAQTSCGGSDSTSGVGGTKKLSELTTSEMQVFCDWVAGLYGGYGGTIECRGSELDVTIEGPASQAECLAESATLASTCAATVAQTETCLRSISTCDEADDAKAAAACEAMATCLPSDDR